MLMTKNESHYLSFVCSRSPVYAVCEFRLMVKIALCRAVETERKSRTPLYLVYSQYGALQTDPTVLLLPYENKRLAGSYVRRRRRARVCHLSGGRPWTALR